MCLITSSKAVITNIRFLPPFTSAIFPGEMLECSTALVEHVQGISFLKCLCGPLAIPKSLLLVFCFSCAVLRTSPQFAAPSVFISHAGGLVSVVPPLCIRVLSFFFFFLSLSLSFSLSQFFPLSLSQSLSFPLIFISSPVPTSLSLYFPYFLIFTIREMQQRKGGDFEREREKGQDRERDT